MKKLNFLLGVLAIVICLTGCNKESEELPTLSKNEVAAIESVKMNYLNLMLLTEAT